MEYIQVNLATYEQKPHPGVQDLDQTAPAEDEIGVPGMTWQESNR